MDSPGQSWLSSQVSTASSCPCHWLHFSSTQWRSTLQRPPPYRRLSREGPFWPQRTSISSPGGSDFGPSWRRHLYVRSSPVYCWCEHPGYLNESTAFSVWVFSAEVNNKLLQLSRGWPRGEQRFERQRQLGEICWSPVVTTCRSTPLL